MCGSGTVARTAWAIRCSVVLHQSSAVRWCWPGWYTVRRHHGAGDSNRTRVRHRRSAGRPTQPTSTRRPDDQCRARDRRNWVALAQGMLTMALHDRETAEIVRRCVPLIKLGRRNRGSFGRIRAHPSRTWMPQVCVAVWPGWRTSRSSAVTKAFGGQAMGSMATAVRRRSGPSVSPVNTCSQR
jgi:hypothetical protein